MKIKKIAALLLLAAVVVGMCGCSVKEKDVIGVWQREVLYMEYYGCNTEMIVSFAEDGSFSAMLLEEGVHNMLNYAGGTWRLEEDTVIADRNDGTGNSLGAMEFTYNKKNHTISFEGYDFEKID